MTASQHALQGPHFVDWQALSKRGARSIISVPVYCCKAPVAVLTLASAQPHVFLNEAVCVLLAAMLAPYAQTLRHETKRSEIDRVVQQVLTLAE